MHGASKEQRAAESLCFCAKEKACVTSAPSHTYHRAFVQLAVPLRNILIKASPP